MILRHLVILVALSSVVFFTNLGGPRLWDRDEPRNSGCARDMLARGDWIVPTFNAELREHKPVLTYWFMMTAYAVFDDPEFAPRFWPALLGVATVIMTYFIGRRLFNPSAGLWAGTALATFMLFGISARAATHDSVLTFCTTLSMFAYVRLAFRRKEPSIETVETLPEPSGNYFPRSLLGAIALHATMGLVTLAKGPVPWIIATAAIGMFLLVMHLPDRPRKGRLAQILAPFDPRHIAGTAWMMRPLTAFAVVLLIAGPWFVLVHLKTDGQFTEGFFIGHNIRRAATAMEGHGVSQLWLYPIEFLLYYPAILLVGIFPWTILGGSLVVATTHWIRRRDPWRISFIFLVCWIGVWVVAFSVPRTKLPTYITPAFPALALLIGAYMHRWIKARHFPGFLEHKPAFSILIVTGIVSMIGLLGFGNRIMPGTRWLGLIGLVPLVGGIIALRAASAGSLARSALALAGTAAIFSVSALALGAQVVSWQQKNHLLLDAVRSRSATPIVASFGRLEPTWVYYLGQPIEEIPHSRENPAPGVARAAEVLAKPDGFLITTVDRAELLRPSLPQGVKVIEQVPYFGRRFGRRRDPDLVVLGHVQ